MSKIKDPTQLQFFLMIKEIKKKNWVYVINRVQIYFLETMEPCVFIGVEFFRKLDIFCVILNNCSKQMVRKN